jgi:hypothetical protein
MTKKITNGKEKLPILLPEVEHVNTGNTRPWPESSVGFSAYGTSFDQIPSQFPFQKQVHLVFV